MRISDWGSDVCSSELISAQDRKAGQVSDDGSILASLNTVPAPSKWRRTFLIRRHVSKIMAQQCQPWCWRYQAQRSEEHTSELQSLMRISYDVFCLKKKKNNKIKSNNTTYKP